VRSRTGRGTSAVAVGLALVVLGGASAAAQEPADTVVSADVSQFPQVKVVVSLPGTKDLGVGDVQISESGNEIPEVIVKSLAVANGEYQSVALVVDDSSAASARETKLLADTALEFLNAVPNTVPFGVVTLAEPHVLQSIEFHNQPSARKALASIRPTGADPDLPGALRTASGLFPLRGQHNVVVFSTDAATDTSLKGDVAKALDKEGVRVFAIALGSEAGSDLAALADETAGSAQAVPDSGLQSATDHLSQVIGDQYLLSYQSVAEPGATLDLRITAGGQTFGAEATVPEDATPGVSPTPNPALFAGTRGYILIIVIIVALILLSSIPGRVRDRRRRGAGGGGGGGSGRGWRRGRRDGGGAGGEGSGRGWRRGRRDGGGAGGEGRGGGRERRRQRRAARRGGGRNRRS
jgi:hypothetical protein